MSEPEYFRVRFTPEDCKRLGDAGRELDQALEAASVACRRCSGGSGLLCDRCTVEVVVAALDTVRETAWPEPPA